eukprot:scaffold50479_cov17-Tisochrysis_lutea.AAC.2
MEDTSSYTLAPHAYTPTHAHAHPHPHPHTHTDTHTQNSIGGRLVLEHASQDAPPAKTTSCSSSFGAANNRK